VRVYPPVSLRLPSAVLPALLKRQLTISRTSAEFMQAYRKDTIARVEERRETATALIRDLKHRPQAERRRLTQGICEIVGTELPASLMMRDEQVRNCARPVWGSAHTRPRTQSWRA
ncbi:MAG: hypothetical protein ACREYE_20645, partial [Gammaproteobacteria bacterium]